MILNAFQLRDIYEAFVVPMGHPDPVGYITRALLMSGGDAEYVGGDGKLGFMPVDPRVAMEMIGTGNVYTLQDNVTATVTMDLMFFTTYGTLEDMMVAFHFGEALVSPDGIYRGNLKKFIDNVYEMREDVRDIVSPRRATAKDVFRLLKLHLTDNETANKDLIGIIETIMEEK